MQKVLRLLGILATISLLLVIVAGAVVTKTGSGDGCGPNWPLCHGRLIPEVITLKTLIEYTHRLVTLIAGILIFTFSIWSGIKYRKNKEVLWMAIGSLFFLLLQSMMGALAVVYGQSDVVMALHFGISLLSYATLFTLTCYTFQIDKREKLPTLRLGRGFQLFLLTLLVGTYVVVYSGAYVRHTGSMLGCSTWPLCNGQWFPAFEGPAGIQFAHRLLAFALFLGFIGMLVHVYKKYRDQKPVLFSSVLIFLLLIAQILTGAFVIFTSVSLETALAHAIMIILLFGQQFYLTLYGIRR